MVIDSFTSRPSVRQWSLISLFTARPSTRQWSSISLHQDSLWGNGHLSLYIETLYEALVIDFFTSRPSAWQWSLIPRPSMRQWSSISLHQDPLQGNGHGFSLHRGPLWVNGHRFLYVKALCKEMIIYLFPFDIEPLLRIGLICFFKKSKRKIIKQSDFSDRDPLHDNGHRIL